MFSTVFRVLYLLNWSEAGKMIPDRKKALCLTLYGRGAVMFVFGFFIWNLDNVFCGTLTRWKAAMGWPAAFFLEGIFYWPSS